MGKIRLVGDRKDFFFVYSASLCTAVAFLSYAALLNGTMTPSVILYWSAVSVFISIVPPFVAMLVPSGRRAVQVLFGMILLPVVGLGAIYINETIRLIVHH